MDGLNLIGAVAAALLHERSEGVLPDDGVARFMLDRLTGEQVASIVRAVLASPIADRVKIAVPRPLVADQELPEDVVTDERTVALRHAEHDRPILLLANTDDDQGASLGLVTLLGAKQLTEDPRHWVEAASAGLGLPDDQIKAWNAALKGLASASEWTLIQTARYAALTRKAIKDEGKPLSQALGWALPALSLPRDSQVFSSLKTKDQETASRWKQLFLKVVSERKPLLAKQRANRQAIEPEELRAQFDAVRSEFNSNSINDVEAFLSAPPGWNAAAATLAGYEWEADNIFLLFSGLKQRKMRLGDETIHFFEYEKPDALSEAEKEYLNQLKQRALKEPREDDREFFEAHRDDLDRNLRSKWERFVFGRPIECADFVDGLLLAVERLFAQASGLDGSRRLVVKSAKRTRAQWLDLNADVGLAFVARYRGLPQMMGDRVTWDTPHLFEFDALLERARERKKYRRNESVARSSLQIKFDIVLVVQNGGNEDKTSVQLIWTGRPAAIGLELPGDLERLEKRPFVVSEVARLPVSRKGALQTVSLSDVGTLQPAFAQDAGSLVPRLAAGDDLSKLFPRAVRAAESEGRISAESSKRIIASWDAWSRLYAEAIRVWREEGLAATAVYQQADAYRALLQTLSECAGGDLNRQSLVQPILKLGCIGIVGGAPSAIVAPWHPLRMTAVATKLSSFAGLVRHLLTADEVNFGDQRLFFADLRSELAHPYYPEIAVGYDGGQPILLSESSTVNDYSLLERPVRDRTKATTDVDPNEAARQIRDLVDRYLELQPHERANLSIMLYNCDAAGLPLAALSALSSVQDEDEVHCNVLVRHRDRERLGRVYSELLDRTDVDADALVASETSKTFMSKLRIGVSLNGVSGGGADKDRAVDIAFLHDVVSGQAREAWFAVDAADHNPSLSDHVPPRWSYRRVTAEDELKATVFLTCPRQPDVGWAYVDAVASAIRQDAVPAGKHMLPARQISFQDQPLRAAFDEVHGLAEWVATYDELLDKRQLSAQGVNVIRYRRQRTHGRNMVVSSTSEPRILHVLVRRRLTELGLGLTEDKIADLAKRLVADAAQISGDIVLRAAKRGVSAGELIGLVLSRALVAEELGSGATIAWFLLDDYAEWLGQREEGLADILALSVTEASDGSLRLRVIVTEAKFVDEGGAAEAIRKSRLQLSHTVKRIEDALFGDPGRMDRDLWLSRIADLLLDGATAVGRTGALEKVRDAIRAGTIPLDLRGYSHVFVYSSVSETASLGDQELLPDVSGGLQEVFSREGVRRALLAYERNEPLEPIRAALGEHKPWRNPGYRLPAPRVKWTGDIVQATARTVRVPDGTSPSSDEPASGVRPDAEQAISNTTASVAPPSPPHATPAAPYAPNLEDAAVTSAAAITAQANQTAFSRLVAQHAEPDGGASPEDQAWLEATSQKLRTALLGYQLQAKVVGSRLTPNAALIRFQGTDRLRVEDIESKQSSLLTTHGLRVISVSPMPGEIVIGVARPKRQTVSLWNLWARRKLNRNAAGVNTSFVLGQREIDGEILYLNLGGPFEGGAHHEPHTLVAGATGSGKSVLIQALILDIAATNPSRLAQIHLIDPKMGVDYAALEKLPHVRGGVVVDQSRAMEVLTEAVDEMEARYAKFRSVGARDIQSYNLRVQPRERLPMIFLVHDEFAEWMLSPDYKDAVANIVSRLGVKARAAGIHLIFAAQRPDATVMPMQLRDNLGNRLILKVASVGTSEIALGSKGAEQLLGLGHMAARLSGEPDLIFAQAPFLSDSDINAAVAAIAATAFEVVVAS